MTSGLDVLRSTKTVLLTTHRRDGTPVPTAVSIAFAGDRAFFRTYDKAGKAKRLRRDPHVEVAPATVAGKATGPAIEATATLLDSGQARLAARALAGRHRLLQRVLVPLFHRLKHYRTLHYELRAVS